MSDSMFSEQDLEKIERLGISHEEVSRQVAQLRCPPPFVDLSRPCQQGDGVKVLSLEAQASLIDHCDRAAKQGRITKFVPASGAATRMFRSPLAILAESPGPDRLALEMRKVAGDEAAADTLAFIDQIDDFAFSAEMRRKLSALGVTGDRLTTGAEIAMALSLLTSGQLQRPVTRDGDDGGSAVEGFGFAVWPKALIPFHRQDGHSQSALDEHFAEAAAYGRDEGGRCRLHLTISEVFRDRFCERISMAKARLRAEREIDCDVTLSVQSSATDTIALALDDTPFRAEDGSILFRPGGHGALIYNLDALTADIVLIKNIDNVIPRHLRGDTILWKKLLTGCLLELQDKSFDLLRRLHECGPDKALVVEAATFVGGELGTPLPPQLDVVSLSEQTAMVIAALNRPLRICGVVMNEGEPGGGPFWVRSEYGESKQIVETSQINLANREQVEILAAATHFNPVDLACGLRNWRGESFALLDFVDPATSFVSAKSEGGRELKALERPGLWNGAMAGWHTVFVEVPLSTFTPVKTILDLLRPVHQPEATER